MGDIMATNDVDSAGSSKRVPRKRVVRRVVPKKETSTRDSSAALSTRKAPARAVTESRQERKSLTKYYVIAAFAIAVLVGAVWIGSSDNGQIDVGARTLEINNQAAQDAADTARANGDTSQGEVIPVQNTPPVVPASAMMPSDTQPSQNQSSSVEAPVEEASSTESAAETESSTESATSTDGVGGEGAPVAE